MNERGSLLFETFIAMMILSVAVTSTLRIFGEALFVSRQNRERTDVKDETRRLLFEWFANPADIRLLESGSVTVPLSSDGAHSDYWVEIKSERLAPTRAEDESEKGEQEMKEEPAVLNVIRESGEYYRVDLQTTKENRRPVFGLTAVIFKTMQAGKK